MRQENICLSFRLLFNRIMKLYDFLHRTCIIIPLLNGVIVCGTQGPRARCAGCFQHIVLYTTQGSCLTSKPGS